MVVIMLFLCFMQLVEVSKHFQGAIASATQCSQNNLEAMQIYNQTNKNVVNPGKIPFT